MDQEQLIGVQEGFRFKIFSHDGECVLYDKISGDIHYFDNPCAEIVLTLSKQPQTRSSLVKILSKSLNQPVNTELEQYLDNFVLKCQDLELLEVREHK